MKPEQALKWLYAGHLYEVAVAKDLDHEDYYCGFCAVIRDSIGLSTFADLSTEELTEGMHPLMQYLLDNDTVETAKSKS